MNHQGVLLKIYRTFRIMITKADSGSLVKIFRVVLSKFLVPAYYLDHLLSSKKSAFELSFSQEQSLSVFCLVHHSAKGILDDYDKSILSRMKSLGFKTILITNSSQMNFDCADIIVPKGKFGRDMSSLRDLARSFSGSKCEKFELFFMNNSIVWDVQKLEREITRLRLLPTSRLVFPTSSKYPCAHVQPYFMYLNLEGSAIIRFADSFEWIRNWHLKRSIVYFGEYRILKMLSDQGWPSTIMAPYDEVVCSENILRRLNGEPLLQSNSIFYNPTQHMWRALPSFGIWAVKKSLVTFNPAGVENQPESIGVALETLNRIHARD